MKPAAYVLADFVAACGVKGRVRVSKGSLETASSDFRLETAERVLEFIADGGLENPRRANTAPWHNNPNPSVPIDVDSYDFYSGPTFGYAAFFYNPTTKLWIIKSFKKNDPIQANNKGFLQLGDALRMHLGKLEK